jgi:predicted metal-dependent enzyme (double-stranded beta helix superfamily)
VYIDLSPPPAALATQLGALARDHGPSFRARAQFCGGVECHHELVHAGPDVEIWLLSWLPGQITPIHDHGGALTVTTVLSGALFEERFEHCGDQLVRPAWTTRREAGALDPIDPRAIHRVQPIGRVITLHLYAPSCVDGRIYQVAA